MNKSSPPPGNTPIHLSTSTCSLRGDPPFTAFYTHENTGTESIWALARLFSHFCYGFKARAHPDGKRRIGLLPLVLADEWDEEALDLENTELKKFDPGQKMSRSYTLSAVDKEPPFIFSDMHQFQVGYRYKLWLKSRRWRWIFASDVPEEAKVDQKMTALLKQRNAVEWYPSSSVVFEVVE